MGDKLDAVQAKDAVLDVPVEVLAKAVYVAELDDTGQRHKEVPADIMKLPVGAKLFEFSTARADLPDTSNNVFICRAELSLDGGATWSPKAAGEKTWPWGVFPVGFHAAGGEFLDPYGKPAQNTIMSIPVPESDNPNRQIRVWFVPLQDLTASIWAVCK